MKERRLALPALTALATAAALAIGLQLAAPQSVTLLRYDRAGLLAGEYWRLVSAHVVHFDWRHLLMNLAGAVLVRELVRGEFRPLQWLAIALGAITAIDAGLWWLHPDLAWYVGASGLLHGVLVAGLLAGVWRGDLVSRIALPVVAAKLWWESRGGDLGITGGMPVVHEAHFYGAVGATAVVLLLAAWRWHRSA